GPADAGEHLRPRQLAQLPDLLEQRLGARGEIETARTPIGGVRPALEQALRLHPIEQTHHRHRLDLGELRQPCLAHPLVVLQARQHLALRQREAEFPRPLLEAQHVTPAHILQQEAEVPQARVHSYRPNIITPDIISCDRLTIKLRGYTAHMSLFDLSGRVAVVTGSSRGIGRAVAERLAEQGANVVVSSRTAETTQAVADGINSRPGGRAIAVPANISSHEELTRLIERTREAFGRIDILVCNAATNIHFGP